MNRWYPSGEIWIWKKNVNILGVRYVQRRHWSYCTFKSDIHIRDTAIKIRVSTCDVVGGCKTVAGASTVNSNKGSLRARAHEWWMAVADQPTRGAPHFQNVLLPSMFLSLILSPISLKILRTEKWSSVILMSSTYPCDWQVRADGISRHK